MTSADILSMLKVNLEIANNTFDTYLGQLMRVALKSIEREGITIEISKTDDDFSVEDIEDCNLIVMYAAYLYRKRAEDTATMPRMLRYALNQRLFSQKAKVKQ